jgi:hypothetical protein
MFRLATLFLLPIALTAVTLDDPTPLPPSSLLHRVSIVDVPSIAKSLIAFPVRCGASGEMVFRLYRPGDTMGAPFLEVARGATTLATSFDFQSIHDDSIKSPKSLRAFDFQIQGGKLYILAEDDNMEAFVLKFSMSDGSFDSAIALEKGFQPQKLGTFSSGGFIATGTIGRQDSATKSPVTEVATLQYGPDGRFQQYVHVVGDFSIAGPKPTSEDMGLLAGTLTSQSGANVYVLRPGKPSVIFTLNESGGKPERNEIWSPGEGWRPFSFQMEADRAIIGFLYDVKDSKQSTQLVQYNFALGSASFMPNASYYFGDDVVGAFGCTDWRGSFYTITGRNNHISVAESRAD